MPRTAEDIWQLYLARRAAMGEDIQRMMEIQAVMNWEMGLPLPELTEEERPAVANLAQQGMAQMGRRVAAVDPVVVFPSLNPGAKTANEDAINRERLVNSWHYENDSRILRAQRARRFLAYAACPVVLKPNSKLGIPCWYNRHPLHTLPAETEFNDYRPSDCIFIQTHTYAWLNDRYPEQTANIKKPYNWDPELDNSEQTFTVLEYIDEYVCAHILIAPDVTEETPGYQGSYGTNAELLSVYDNMAGCCLAITPGSINLDKQLGHFDGIIGMYQAQAMLMAMTIVGQRRTIWPREWLVSNPNETARVISIPDPASGQPGVLQGGSLTTQQMDPSFRADQIQDMLEHAARQTASLPSELGGMSPTNVRTGRRGAQVMGAAIDFTISEAQDVFAKSTRHENEVAIEIDKAYFNSRRSVFLMTKGFSGKVNYMPTELWSNPKHMVEYPIQGVDLDQLPVVAGQRIAMNTMSRKTFMKIDPLIPGDGTEEERQIQREGVVQAFLAQIQALANQPEGPYQPVHLARLDKMLAEGDMDLYEAIIQLQGEIQQEQAELAPDPAAAQPGLSMPGQGVEQPTSIPEQGPSLTNLTQLLSSLGQVESARGRAS
jgi:hypothetical protein